MPDLVMRDIAKKIMECMKTIIIDEKKDRFVIYTNGMGGKLVKKYLDVEFHIKPEYIIDNKSYDGKHILSIEQAKSRDNKGVYFLICSWHGDYYEEIRKKIYDAFPEEQIIDLFPRMKKSLPTDEEICNVLQYVNMYLEK
ncbi:MAG: hypothetical protein HFI92_02820 [Lachnospiraceae bacterium]|nr:hypothetical protein [Lachnospiraceae bacterium]